jgi:hypothetical protein
VLLPGMQAWLTPSASSMQLWQCSKEEAVLRLTMGDWFCSSYQHAKLSSTQSQSNFADLP